MQKFESGQDLETPWGDPTAYTPSEDSILRLVTSFTTDEMDQLTWKIPSPEKREMITIVERKRVREALAHQPEPSPDPSVNAHLLKSFVSSFHIFPKNIPSIFLSV